MRCSARSRGGFSPVLEGAVNELKRIKDKEEAHLYYMMTAMFGVKVYGAYLEWCDEVKQIFEERREVK
jgi:hypothetical protein